MKNIILVITSLAIMATVILYAYLYQQVTIDADNYFEKVRQNNYNQAIKKMEKLFIHKNLDVYPLYYNCAARYIKKDFKNSPFVSTCEKHISDMPQDVTTTYFCSPEKTDSYLFGDTFVEKITTYLNYIDNTHNAKGSSINGVNWKGIFQTGWAFGIRQKYNDSTFVQYIVSPYAVSYRKNDYNIDEHEVPIQECINNAYKFYTENIQSEYKNWIVKDISSFLEMNTSDLIDNYYSWHYDENAIKEIDPWLSSRLLFKSPCIANFSDYMYTPFYYVYIRAYKPDFYTLKLDINQLKNDKKEYIKDKRKSLIIQGLVLFILLIIIWVATYIRYYREKKECITSLKKRLITKCNPKKFIHKDNGKLLDVANDIFCQALDVDNSEQTKIMLLVSRAEKELDLEFITQMELKKITKRCNPKNFMKPYDAYKVEKANKLYRALKNERLSRSEFEHIKDTIDELYK